MVMAASAGQTDPAMRCAKWLGRLMILVNGWKVLVIVAGLIFFGQTINHQTW